MALFDLFKSKFGGFGAHQQLGEINGFVFKAGSHDIQRRNDVLLYDLQRRQCAQKFGSQVRGLFFQAFYNGVLQGGAIFGLRCRCRNSGLC